MSQLNKQDAFLHWALNRPKGLMPFTPTCPTCKHMKFTLTGEGQGVSLCLLGQHNEFSEYEALADYLEAQGEDAEEAMAGLCPYYSNDILDAEGLKRYNKVFGAKDIPPQGQANELMVITKAKPKPKRFKEWVAVGLLAALALSAIVIGAIKTPTPTPHRPEVKEGTLKYMRPSPNGQ
jgi:hypothetical protein